MKSSKQQERHAKWRSLIEEQESSGLNQSEFCKKRNLVLSQFVYYRGLIKAKESAGVVNPKSFMPVQISKPEINTASEIRIALPNGFQCSISSRIEVSQIKRLVEVLLSC